MSYKHTRDGTVIHTVQKTKKLLQSCTWLFCWRVSMLIPILPPDEKHCRVQRLNCMVFQAPNIDDKLTTKDTCPQLSVLNIIL